MDNMQVLLCTSTLLLQLIVLWLVQEGDTESCLQPTPLADVPGGDSNQPCADREARNPVSEAQKGATPPSSTRRTRHVSFATMNTATFGSGQDAQPSNGSQPARKSKASGQAAATAAATATTDSGDAEANEEAAAATATAAPTQPSRGRKKAGNPKASGQAAATAAATATTDSGDTADCEEAAAAAATTAARQTRASGQAAATAAAAGTTVSAQAERQRKELQIEEEMRKRLDQTKRRRERLDREQTATAGMYTFQKRASLIQNAGKNHKLARIANAYKGAHMPIYCVSCHTKCGLPANTLPTVSCSVCNLPVHGECNELIVRGWPASTAPQDLDRPPHCASCWTSLGRVLHQGGQTGESNAAHAVTVETTGNKKQAVTNPAGPKTTAKRPSASQPAAPPAKKVCCV